MCLLGTTTQLLRNSEAMLKVSNATSSSAPLSLFVFTAAGVNTRYQVYRV